MKTITDLLRDITTKYSEMQKLKQNMPRIIGVESVKVLKENFKKQGYDSGTGFTAWKKRSKATDTAYDYNRTSSYRTPKLHKKSKYKNPYKGSVVSSKRPIMVQTGNTRDALNFQANGNKTIIGIFPRIVMIGGKSHDAFAHAKILNEGGTGTWGRHSTKIPKRQFMPRPQDPPNQAILNQVKKKYFFELDKFMADWKK